MTIGHTCCAYNYYAIRDVKDMGVKLGQNNQEWDWPVLPQVLPTSRSTRAVAIVTATNNVVFSYLPGLQCNNLLDLGLCACVRGWWDTVIHPAGSWVQCTSCGYQPVNCWYISASSFECLSSGRSTYVCGLQTNISWGLDGLRRYIRGLSRWLGLGWAPYIKISLMRSY